MAKQDYYEILEVERTATDAEISSAYRRAALKYHPDRNPGDEEAVVKFKQCAEAFEVLSDKEKREIYDRYGHEGLERGMGGGASYSNFGDIFGDIGDIFGDSIFGSFFGGGRRGRTQRELRTTWVTPVNPPGRWDPAVCRGSCAG